MSSFQPIDHRQANPKGITHVLNVSDMYVLSPGKDHGLVTEWAWLLENLFGAFFPKVVR